MCYFSRYVLLPTVQEKHYLKIIPHFCYIFSFYFKFQSSKMIFSVMDM